jgi:WXG100 family type VII secretion target
MANEILLRPEEARAEAERMRTAAEEARDTMSGLQQELSNLQDSFRGQAQVSFEERFTEWHTGHTQMVEALEGLAGWLTQAADQLENVDQQMGDSLSGA